MRRQSMKWAFVGGMVVLVVMFGIDLASNGVERIYGPMDKGTESTVGRLTYDDAGQGRSRVESGLYDDEYYNGDLLPEERDLKTNRSARSVEEAAKLRDRHGADEEAYDKELDNDRLPGIPDMREDSTVNKLADGTAGVLQSLSSQGIRFVVSFFESVTD
ncbi:hypothetical protein [Paenibacillus spongiae]|uniref:Uncharacterized protein n=1 Tax=Paenibacillus spongiae TaxID=2909671 RepID=A0ABY5SDM5_9BACL|nr:hypothetical protein [Paenibacillus spongiae]UVI32057.1 hypothetical protein L1F29_09665 [Paenibacillus spongiae]